MIAAATKQKIINYYNQTKFDYTVTWALGSQGAMHYGMWDRRTHTLGRALINENRALARLAHITATDHVLDAGCGVGGSSLFLAREFGCQVTGISLVDDQINTANKRAEKEGLAGIVTFAVADYTATHFSADTFDVVWAVESVCHTPEKRDFLQEAYRLLKPGGKLIIAEYLLSPRPHTIDEQSIIDRWLSGWAIESLDITKNFVAKAKDAGFANVQLQDFTADILPSAKRMYQYTLITAPFERFTRALGWRGQAAEGNFRAARLQYRAFKQGLCTYGVITAIKPTVQK